MIKTSCKEFQHHIKANKRFQYEFIVFIVLVIGTPLVVVNRVEQAILMIPLFLILMSELESKSKEVSASTFLAYLLFVMVWALVLIN